MKCLVFLTLVMMALPNHIDMTEELHRHWEMFKADYMKAYNCEKEELFRKKIFLDNLKFVQEHKAKHQRGEVTFNVEINRFADLSSKEFGSMMNGFKWTKNLARSTNSVEFNVTTDNFPIPKVLDWRKKGAVTPVKDQGNCSSCWAFSAIGSLEGMNFIATKKLVTLSEQNLVDCSFEEGNQGCSGGFMDFAFTYIKKNGGINTEAAYPYEAKDGKCRFKKQSKGAVIKGYVTIPSGDENMLQAAVLQKGPVSIAYDSSQKSFQFYKSGVYMDPACKKTDEALDHSGVVVGYGSLMSADVNRTWATDYWLIKNSWGTDWGLKGYFMLARNQNNMCGVATSAIYPTV